MPLPGSKKTKTDETKSRATRTTQQILSEQEKDATKAAANRADQDLAHNAGEARKAAAAYSDNLELNALITRAKQYGLKMDSDPQFQEDANEIMKAREVDDTKAVIMLKHIDHVLTHDEEAQLPWPMSTRADWFAKHPEGTTNLPPLYDKPKAAGGRAKVETFYGAMVGETTLGKAIIADIERIQAEKDQAKVNPTKARLPEQIAADEKRYNKRLSNLLGALRTAAQVRLMIDDIKVRCPAIVIEWIRDNLPEDVPADADLTMLRPEYGPVVTSPTVLNIWTKPIDPRFTVNAMKQAKQYSIGSFKRWKIDKAIEIAKKNGRPNRVTVDDLIESAKTEVTAAPQPTVNAAAKETAIAKGWIPRDVVDVKRAIEGFMTWHNGDSPSDKDAKHSELVKACNASEEMWMDIVWLYDLTRPLVETNNAKTEQARKQLSDKVA